MREWLAVMVTAGIVDNAPQGQTYRLPAAHAACLTRDGELGNAAVFAQHVAMRGALQGQTLNCLETGDGTGYGDYPCFHQVMAEDSEQTVVGALFDTVLPLIDGMDTLLRDGIDVLDACCGKGFVLLAMAERYPQSRFTGYDLCAEAIADAGRTAAARDLGNIRFETLDMTDFDEPGRYDLI